MQGSPLRHRSFAGPRRGLEHAGDEDEAEPDETGGGEEERELLRPV
jgi:hypothetical protein